MSTETTVHDAAQKALRLFNRASAAEAEVDALKQELAKERRKTADLCELLARLRRAHPQSEDGALRHEAAAEIERLRVALRRLVDAPRYQCDETSAAFRHAEEVAAGSCIAGRAP